MFCSFIAVVVAVVLGNGVVVCTLVVVSGDGDSKDAKRFVSSVQNDFKKIMQRKLHIVTEEDTDLIFYFCTLRKPQFRVARALCMCVTHKNDVFIIIHSLPSMTAPGVCIIRS